MGVGDAPKELSITFPPHHNSHIPKLALKHRNNRFVHHQSPSVPFFWSLGSNRFAPLG